MLNFPGYRLEQLIYESSRTLVYRGVRLTDPEMGDLPIVLKLPRNEFPILGELLQYRNYDDVVRTLARAAVPGVVRPVALETLRNRYAFVMEDGGGQSLVDYGAAAGWSRRRCDRRDGPDPDQPLAWPIEPFLAMALQLTEILDRVHGQRVIHRDLTPSNILIDPQGQVSLIDFSLASLLPQQTQELANPSQLAGTLPYISPEQTGRMNRQIDYRSDFYSLGVTFYELLTGQLPFPARDPLELIYCHLAVTPPRIDQLNPALPKVLGEIIAKLLAKTPDDRYQSAQGLRHDLCLLQAQVQAGSNLGFALGSQDNSDRLVLPEQLYGRADQVTTLLGVFDRVAAGATELVLVSGASGIGKTALVNEIHKPILKQGGYFVRGKFDQYQRSIPFSGVLQALGDLVRQILSESDQAIATWRNRLIALGTDAQVLVEMLPQLAQVIGDLPAAIELTGIAAQQRFMQKLRQLVTEVAQQGALVMFLDDLQWADSASLQLLTELMQGGGAKLLLLGAYRDAEIDPAHGLLRLQSTLLQSAQSQPIHEIRLAPLLQSDLNQLIAQTLHCSRDRAWPLTDWVFQKTQGNPFFARQFIKALYDDGHIRHSAEGWQCDVAQVRTLALTEDVVDFMVERLQKLPTATQQVLQLAACIGNQFDLDTLAIVRDLDAAATAQALWPALSEGLLLPVTEIYKFYQDNNEGQSPQLPVEASPNPRYRFLHDRVQQAAYRLIPEAHCRLTHQRISQLLLQSWDSADQEAHIFDLVNHVNLGHPLGLEAVAEREGAGAESIGAESIGAESIVERELGPFAVPLLAEAPMGDVAPPVMPLADIALAGTGIIGPGLDRSVILQLNLLAGQRAKAAAAYESARLYLRNALDRVVDSDWQADYLFTFELHYELIQVESMLGNKVLTQDLIQLLILQELAPIDRAKLANFLVHFYSSQDDLQMAIDLGFAALTDLNVVLPEIDLATLAVPLISLEAVDRLPEMTDALQRQAVLLLMNLCTPTFATGQHDLYIQVALGILSHCQRYGFAPAAAHAYISLGMFIGGQQGQFELGYQAGNVALKLLDRFNARDLSARIQLLYNGQIRHWKESLHQTIAPLEAAVYTGLEVQDLEFSSYCIDFCSLHWLRTCRQLETAIEGQSDLINLPAFNRGDRPFTLHYARVWHQLTLNWTGQTTQVDRLAGPICQAEVLRPMLLESHSFVTLAALDLAEAIAAYSFGDYAAALGPIAAARASIAKMTSTLRPWHRFYDVLILVANYGDQDAATQALWRSQIEANLEDLRYWTTAAPMNYSHLESMALAEFDRICDRRMAAMELYDEAILLATENDFLGDQALAYELAARFYQGWDRQTVAQTYITHAYYAYARWGAKAKVEQLERDYGLAQSEGSQPELLATYQGSTDRLDLAAVLRASQALSRQIHSDDLLRLLLRLISENTGAQRCTLILNRGDALWVEAQLSPLGEWLDSCRLEDCANLPQTIVNYVAHSGEARVLYHAAIEVDCAKDDYIQRHQPKSILCQPILNQGKPIGLIYLENNLAIGAFTEERLEIVNVLCTQAAISLDHARLYQDLESRVQQRTAELEEANQTLQQEIVERQQIESHLLHTALHDPLTGLPNRSLLIERLDDALAVLKQNPDSRFAVLFIDFDRFKVLNDSLGHIVGDELLIACGSLLRTCLRPTDIVARFGGDEFVLLLEGIQGVEDATQIADRILTQLRSPFQLGEHRVFMTASIGVVVASPDYGQSTDLLRDADTAMYRAKSNGKARYEIFTQTMHVQAFNRLWLEHDLWLAIERNEFSLNYQPIVDLASGRITSFEALLRWNHPERGWVSPADFIPVAEETGLIVPIGDWVLKTACAQQRQWLNRFPIAKQLRINVNVASAQMVRPDFLAKLDSTLALIGLPGRCLRLEITEGTLMQHTDAIQQLLQDLRQRDIQIALDDFGVGYSSLSYLNRIPISSLKIDRSFVQNMTHELESFEIVRTILLLGQSLEVDVVAEGIETEPQLTALQEMGCQYGQGFLASKPLDSSQATEILAKPFILRTTLSAHRS
jgi:diguanylate cyclase (GGDEF)-like protein